MEGQYIFKEPQHREVLRLLNKNDEANAEKRDLAMYGKFLSVISYSLVFVHLRLVGLT